MGKNWTIEDIKKLQGKGISISGMNPNVPPALKAKSGIKQRKKAKKLCEMEQLLYILGIKYETEYRFSMERQFRFDICIPDHKIGIEYEGLMSDISGHTTNNGYTSNCTKYNLAQIEGYIVLRYTVINAKEFIHDIKRLLKL